MPQITAIYGEQHATLSTEQSDLLGDAVMRTGLPLEQPCGGRGTCGKCKVLVEGGVGLFPPDEIERDHLTEGEIAVGTRLACRARIESDVSVMLAPTVVYSSKTFKAGSRYKKDKHVPLGLGIDFGSTTVAAFLTMLDRGEVCAGAASLNQQTVFGADVISRLGAALNDAGNADRLQKLALSSINQAVDGLLLSQFHRARVERVTIVCNSAMHHLLTHLPVGTLAVKPFQPHDLSSIRDASALTDGLFPRGAKVMLPPLIGGYVGSDALACLAYFGYNRPSGPMLTIDLGTNGEVLVTDGRRIVVGSTAAGPAFEGVNISCGTRAVDGAIIGARFENGDMTLETIADAPQIGVTGSGLLSLVHQLRKAGFIEASGRISHAPPALAGRLITGSKGARHFRISSEGDLRLTQWDVRELQKAKAAIRAAVEILLRQLDLTAADLQRVILTGSFGGKIDIDSALDLGLLPPVSRAVVEAIPNGAGFGAAMMLTDEGFALGEDLAARARQFDLESDSAFEKTYVNALSLTPELGTL
jgi:uncharacterized 2Fe-2S/4Fe-4S cluster protein (DUF4445 family)